MILPSLIYLLYLDIFRRCRFYHLEWFSRDLFCHLKIFYLNADEFFHSTSCLRDTMLRIVWCLLLCSLHKVLCSNQLVGLCAFCGFWIILACFLRFWWHWWCWMFFLIETAVLSTITNRFNTPYVFLILLVCCFM